MPAAAAHARHPRALPFVEPTGYALHRPENTLLQQLAELHYPAFREMRAMAGRWWRWIAWRRISKEAPRHVCGNLRLPRIKR